MFDFKEVPLLPMTLVDCIHAIDCEHKSCVHNGKHSKGNTCAVGTCPYKGKSVCLTTLAE